METHSEHNGQGMTDGPERRNSQDEGGDPACWGHLVLEPVDTLSDPQLAQLLRNLSDAVVVCDTEGRITFWNSAAERVFGWSAAEVLGGSLDIIVPQPLRDRHWEGYYNVIRTGITSYHDRLLEVPAIHRDGNVLTISLSISTLTIEGTTRLGGIGAVIRDETTRLTEIESLRADSGRLDQG